MHNSDLQLSTTNACCLPPLTVDLVSTVRVGKGLRSIRKEQLAAELPVAVLVSRHEWSRMERKTHWLCYSRYSDDHLQGATVLGLLTVVQQALTAARFATMLLVVVVSPNTHACQAIIVES